MSTKHKIAPEAALLEFARMCELARVDTDESSMSEEDKKAWKELQGKLAKHISSGSLVVDGSGHPTFAGITLNHVRGSALITLQDGLVPGKQGSALVSALCEMCGVPAKSFNDLHPKDLHVWQEIGKLFFGTRVIDRIVRNGADEQLSTGGETYALMLLQVAIDYPGLPDPRTLTIPELVFFYNGLRKQLKKHTSGK